MMEKEVEAPVLRTDARPLTQERLEEVWRQAGEALGIAPLLGDATVQLEEHNNFTVVAENTFFSQDFRPRKTEVLEWIRKETGLSMIDCRVVVRYVEKDAKPSRPDDKYADMLTRNPHLASLRKLFPNLDY